MVLTDETYPQDDETGDRELPPKPAPENAVESPASSVAMTHLRVQHDPARIGPWKSLTVEQSEDVYTIKLLANELDYRLAQMAGSRSLGRREIALARTNLEQAAMWAVKGVTA